jgi:hypothetical protein
VKKLVISRKTQGGEASYKARGLDTPDEREFALQQDCIGAIKAGISECGGDKKAAEAIAKLVLSASAAVHSDLERILRDHGKKTMAENEPS